MENEIIFTSDETKPAEPISSLSNPTTKPSSISQPVAPPPTPSQAPLTPVKPDAPASFPEQPNKALKILKWAAIIAIPLFLLIGSAVWGYQTYVKYYQKVTIEKLLPKDANLVAKITVDPDSKQFQALKNNLEKFPGYSLLEKDIEKARQEQKTADSHSLDRDLESMGLDYDNDIRPILSENAYIVIPDLKPLGDNLKNSLLVATRETKDWTKNIADMTTSPAEKQLAFLDKKEAPTDTRILGEENVKKDTKPLDFIMASEIRDLKKAAEVLEKIKKSQDVTMTERNYSGYKYYSVKFNRDDQDKKDDKTDGLSASKLTDYEETFNALLGNNLVVTSREDYLKTAIDKKKALQPLSGLFSKAEVSSLENDTNYQKVVNDLEQNNRDRFMSLYYNFNYNTLFKDDTCTGTKDYSCDDVTQYFKYPENIISGFTLGFSDEGMVFKKTSNKISGSDFPDEPVSQSLASQIPLKLDDRWADVFFEETDLKTLYDSFKKNNLTDQGQREWNKALEGIRNDVGIDLENDFINVINGNIALVMFSKKNAAPQGMVIAEINNSDKILNTMRTIINKIKEAQIASYENMLKYYDEPSPAMKAYYDKQTPQQKAMRLETKNKYKTLLDKVKNSQITEKTAAGGKVYSYQIVTEEDAPVPGLSLSMSFGLNNDKIILGSDSAAIESLMNGMASSSGEKLAQNENFKTASKYFFPENYSSAYINSTGVWNAIEYYINQFENSMIDSQNKYCLEDQISPEQCARIANQQDKEKQQMDEYAFAIGAIIRTIKLFGSSNSTDNEFIKNSTFVNIQSLPQEEKDRANKTLTTMHDDYVSARDKAKAASFKANMHSLQPAIIICCDDSTSNRLNTTPGEKTCSSGSITSTLPKKDEISSSTDPVYTVTADCSSPDPTLTVSNVNAGTCTGATITSSTVSFSGC